MPIGNKTDMRGSIRLEFCHCRAGEPRYRFLKGLVEASGFLMRGQFRHLESSIDENGGRADVSDLF